MQEFDQNINYDYPPNLQIGTLDNNAIALLVEFKRETNRVDYKQTLDISKGIQCAKLSKHVVAFANNGGGYLVIGVAPEKLQPVGITDRVAKNFDPTIISQIVSGYVSPVPEIHTFVGTYKYRGRDRKIGLIFIPEFKKRPHFIKKTSMYASKNFSEGEHLHEGTVYVRQHSASKPIDDNAWEELLERFYNKAIKTGILSTGQPGKREIFSLERSAFFEEAESALGHQRQYNFKDKIRSIDKEIKVQWERLLLKHKDNGLNKDDIRYFKSNILLPNLDKLTDLGILSIEKQRFDIFKSVISFFKHCIQYSIYCKYSESDNGFNLSSETEHLSYLLPAYETAVRLFILGSIAVSESGFNFIVNMVDEKVSIIRKKEQRRKYISLMGFPWYAHIRGVGNLTTFFEDVKLRLADDIFLRERYFTLVDDNYIDSLCQFDFLVRLRINSQLQSKTNSYYPNFARYYYTRTEKIITTIVSKDKALLKSFKIGDSEFRDYLKELDIYLKSTGSYFKNNWLAFIPEWLKEYMDGSKS